MVGRTSRLAEKSPELFMLFSREIARWELREDDAPTPAATWAVVELVRTPKGRLPPAVVRSLSAE